MRAAIASVVVALAACASGQYVTYQDSDFPECRSGIADCLNSATAEGVSDVSTSTSTEAQLDAVCESSRELAKCLDLCTVPDSQRAEFNDMVEDICNADSLDEVMAEVEESMNVFNNLQSSSSGTQTVSSSEPNSAASFTISKFGILAAVTLGFVAFF